MREPVTTFAGTHYQLTDAICEPKPVQSPLPLLIGGKGNRMMGVVARYADEWNMWGLADDIAERSAVLDQRCEAIGRDPAEIKRSAQALVLLTDDRAKADAFLAGTGARAAIAGTTDDVAEAVAAWQAVGLDEVIVPDFTLGRGARKLEHLDALIEQVAPSFRLIHPALPTPVATCGCKAVLLRHLHPLVGAGVGLSGSGSGSGDGVTRRMAARTLTLSEREHGDDVAGVVRVPVGGVVQRGAGRRRGARHHP